MTGPSPSWWLLPVLLLAALALGCGMKGPPLPPLVILPVPVDDLEVSRTGDRVYVWFTLPTRNTDGGEPADLDRVEVYALTTETGETRQPQPSQEDWLDAATLVATIQVRPPDEGEPMREEEAALADAARPPAQGDEVTVVEVLTPELMVPVVFDDDDDEPDEVDEIVGPAPIAPLVSPPLPRPPRRTYLVRGISTRGREARPSRRESVPILPAPTPPSAPTVTYTESAIVVTWEPPPTARLPIQPPIGEFALPSTPVIELSTPSRYQVYDVTPDDSGDADATEALPEPLNTLPLSTPIYTDRRVEFGVERCYAVRVQDTVDSLDVMSSASTPTCVTLIDTFPPAAPSGVIAVATEGSISLVWDPSPAPDVAGYVVLRGLAGAATLEPVTSDPIGATNFRDTDVDAGVSYEYAVQAIDTASPPNVSMPSGRVVERAR